MKIDITTIDDKLSLRAQISKQDFDKCVWKELLQNKKSSTRESVKETKNIKNHSLYPCVICSGYDSLKCENYRVLKVNR